MSRKLLVSMFVIVALLLVSAVVLAQDNSMGRPGNAISVYVTGQGLFYDSIVVSELPQKGRFQKLEMGEFGPQTAYGPGDVGYLGGRWWVDVNGDDIQNDGDMFFLCPLLGPGHE